MNETEQNKLEQRTREVFAREVAGLDAATRSKLNRARQRALSELERPSFALLRRPLPQAAAAAVALAAIGTFVVMRGGSLPGEAVPDIAAAADIEILLAEDDMEFLEEIEFYAWLESQGEFSDLEDAEEGAG